MDRVEEALGRELQRARDERRWIDADEIAREVEAHRTARAAASNVVDMAMARKGRR